MEGERRQSKEDLELGKQHMLEVLDNIRKLHMHPDEKLTEFSQLIIDIESDLKKVQTHLDLKKLYADTERRLKDLSERSGGQSRPEDQKAIAQMLMEMHRIPHEIAGD